ncbi:hypothetical protein E4U35_004150 [Claviceps purpurea]|nr:hypothetical protein E4U35_004150 [Claviceps purpurea]
MDAGHPSQQVAGETENLLPSNLPPVVSRSVSYKSYGPGTNITRHTQSILSIEPPEFRVVHGDPVKVALNCATANGGIRVPFICAANRYGPGRRHHDQRPTYEEDLCGRSSLLDTLTRTGPNTFGLPHHPIAKVGGVFSDRVAVYFGPRWDYYEKLEPTPDLPVISVPPLRKPRVNENGSLFYYANGKDKSIMTDKICCALRVCLDHEYDRVVIGDFGLGDGYLNPPQELAEIWRDLFLFDPNLRGQFKSVHFVFMDPLQCTTQCHRDEKQKNAEKNRLRMSARKGTTSTSTRRRTKPLSSRPVPMDMEVFESVFHPDEIKRVRANSASGSSTNMVLSWET